jgi:hypothetical protein
VSSGVTRAREATPSAEVAARVNTIANMMRAGAWKRGRSAEALAELWKLSVSTVENYSAEAWRRVCAESDDAAKARPTIAGTVATSLAQAAEAGEYKAVAALADVWSKVVGARAPEKHQHQVVVAQFEALPPAGKVAWLRERAAALLEEADRVEAEG